MALLSVIRRWHFREGISIREIERRTGLSRNTIRKHLRVGTVEPKFKVPDRPSKLDPFAEKLASWLRAETGKSRKQRWTAWQMHADLVALGYGGSSRARGRGRSRNPQPQDPHRYRRADSPRSASSQCRGNRAGRRNRSASHGDGNSRARRSALSCRTSRRPRRWCLGGSQAPCLPLTDRPASIRSLGCRFHQGRCCGR